MTRYPHLADLQSMVALSLGTSEWLGIDQSRIDAFANATLDDQWIHVDPLRAAAGRFGAPIAHGFLTLSLLPFFMMSAFSIDDVTMTVNYGLNRVRFPSVVPVGSRLRAHFTLASFAPLDGGAQLVVVMRAEREGSSKPVCVAESVLQHFVSKS